MPEVAEAPEEAVDIPASEKVHINRMADKFRDALKATQPAKESKAAQTAQPKSEKVQSVKAVEVSPSQPEPDHAANVEKFKAALDKAEAAPEMKGKAREHWEKLEALKNKYQKDYETLKPEHDRTKAELEAFKKNGGNPEHLAQLEQLRKEVENRDSIIKSVAIEKDPRFIQFYGQRMQAAVAEAREAVGENGSAVVEEIFQLPPGPHRDKEVEALADSLDLSDMRRTDLLAAFRSLKATEKEKAAELAKPEENYKAVQVYQQRIAAAEQERIAQNRARLWQRFEGEIAQDMEGVDKTLADSIRENVAAVVAGKANSDQYIGVLSDAARWRKNEPVMAAQAEELEKLRAQLAEVQAANPTVQTTVSSQPRKVAPHPLDHSDVGPKFRKALAGQR